MANAIDQVKAAIEKTRTDKADINFNKPVSRGDFRTVVIDFQSEMAKALPVHLKNNAERYARQALTLFNNNPKLRECTGISLLSALMRVTEIGLDLSPALGEAYIIPYGSTATVQLGYRGVLKLIHRSGKIKNISAHVVHENDHFEYEYGFNINLKHVPAKGDRGQRIYVYAIAMYGDGGRDLEVWSWDDVMAHGRKFSKGFNGSSSPWKTATDAMAEKTLILALWKRLPIEIEIGRALAIDNSSLSNEAEIKNIQSESDILDITVDAMEINNE